MLFGKSTPKPDRDPYEAHKERAARRQAEQSRRGRDIGPIPPVADADRRRRAESSLETFCTTYFPDVFSLPFSDDHRTILAECEAILTGGGLKALAAQRGFGKSSICQAGALWAALRGIQEFILLVSATAEAASEAMEFFQTSLLTNDALLADWPEAVYPFRRLEGIAQKKQLHQGVPTHIGWGPKKIVFPMIPHSQAAGVILVAAPLLGRIRGMKHSRPDGRTVRPTLVLADDPQTDASAASAAQTARRRNVLTRTVLNLAGPGKRIGVLMPCTVIEPGDLADELLDTKQHPEWNGSRLQCVYEFPAATKLWERYAEILRTPGAPYAASLQRATAFYREHRAEMDAGARVAWPERFEPGEISGLQFAMDRKIMDEAAFLAEFQNAPQRAAVDGHFCPADAIAAKVSGVKRGVVPAEASLVTAGIDVHDRLLYYVVAAWHAETFAGWILDYGTWPAQRRRHFTMRQATATLGRRYPGAGKEGAIHAGLLDLAEALLSRDWPREDGQTARITQALVDSAYKPDTVYSALRASPHAAVLAPSRGRYIGVKNRPLAEYKRKPGDRVGHHWRLTRLPNRRLATVEIDTNYWKSRVHAGFAAAAGDPGSWQLWGQPGAARAQHAMFAEHVAQSESYASPTWQGRTVQEWQELPSHPDNHLFDAVALAAVAASMRGCQIPGTGAPKRRKKRPVRYF